MTKKSLKVIGVGDLQAMMPDLYKHVDEEYLVVNTKSRTILGAIKITNPPQEYAVEHKYEIVYKKKEK